jgi:hypothetical protein
MSNESGTQIDTQLQSIDSATLTPLVQQALDREKVEVAGWTYGRAHTTGTRTRAYRFSGDARDGGQVVPWSLFLKVIVPQPDRVDPSGSHYWKREVLAYQSGLLDDLPGGLVAPRCIGVAEQPEGEFWVWLEEVRDQIGPEWPLEHYGVSARHLGQFNGAYVMGRPLPSYPWLSRGRLRHWATWSAAGIARLRESLDHPLVRRHYPPRAADGLFGLWAQREALLHALHGLPQVFCHFDAFRRNLFARRTADGDYETVAVDWADAGMGAIGEEIAALVAASLYYREVQWGRAVELDTMVFQSYMEGLRHVGWRGDQRMLRLGYAAASVLRYGLIHPGCCLPILLDDTQRARWAQVMGCSMEEMEDDVAGSLEFFLSLGQEARKLMDGLW